MSSTPDLFQEAENILPYMIERRRWYHTWPELSGKENNTVASVCAELECMQIRHVVIPNGGVLGFIDGDTEGKTVLLRADLDALPVEEKECNQVRKRSCISNNPGVSHMCGHDGHIAMLLGAAKMLSAHKDRIKGHIVLMFEQGEEGTFNIGYIHRYMRENHIEPDTCWGIHLYALLDTGKIYLHSGAVMAGVMFFHVDIHGMGGHGARPDAARSPIDCFTAVYDGIAKLRIRNIPPFSPFTYSVGAVHSGTKGNIIPDDLSFDGTIRFFDRNDALRFKEKMEELIANTAQAYSCTADIRISNPCFPVINDPACTELAKEAVAGVLGQESLAETEPWMVSESMCLSLKLWPGVFALLGIRNEEYGSGAENHSADFDIDEKALAYGAAATAAYALSYLDDPVDTDSRKWAKSLEELYEEAGIPFCVNGT